MQRIGVFLSSKDNLPDSYIQAAQEVGEWIGRTGRTLVYGGAEKGLMEVLARSVKSSGGRVMGVVPQILTDRNLVSDTLDITIPTADLNDRKAVMVRESDLLVALPGGIGTLDEVFTVMAANTIGIHRKPVILYNVDGCWDTITAAIRDLCDKKLVSQSQKELWTVIKCTAELEHFIQAQNGG